MNTLRRVVYRRGQASERSNWQIFKAFVGGLGLLSGLLSSRVVDYLIVRV